MHAHTHLSHKYINTYIFMYNAYKYVYTRTSIYPVFRTRSYTYTRGHPRMRVPTRRRTHTRARIGGAAAHNGPRCIDDPPSASRARWRASPGRKGGAYQNHVRHRRGVPRADVRVERRRLLEHLRAEPSAVHADGERGHVSARVRGRPIAYEHARAHGRSTWARVCGGPPSAIRSSG